MNRTWSGASIALMMGSIACGKQQSTAHPSSGDLLPLARASEDGERAAGDQQAEGATAGEPEHAWTDPDNPRCGHPPTDYGDSEFVCFGGNACKAVGICKTQYNACACHNSCKGKARWLVKTRDECESGGGEIEKELTAG